MASSRKLLACLSLTLIYLNAQRTGGDTVGVIDNPVESDPPPQYFNFVTIKPDGDISPMGTDVRVKLFKGTTESGYSGNIAVPPQDLDWDYHTPGFVPPGGGWPTGTDWTCRLYDTSNNPLDTNDFKVVTP